jgi:V/A-type H+-transporting ATPase subunit A
MMRLLGRFLELADEAVELGVPPEAFTGTEVYRRVLRMGEEIAEGEWTRFEELAEAVEHLFAELSASRSAAAATSPA